MTIIDNYKGNNHKKKNSKKIGKIQKKNEIYI